MNPAMSKRIRSLRSRNGRSGSGVKFEQDDLIPLDLSKDPNHILKEILQNICSPHHVSTSRKLGHLNNFVKLLCNLSDTSLISVPMRVIMTCLKSALVSDVKEVRAAAVRVLRYLINDDSTKRLFISLHLDFLVTRCLDISHFNEVERIQVVRLVRKIAHIKRKRAGTDLEPIVPLSLMACIVSISLDGAEERDRVYRTCLAVLCELALLQPWLVVKCNGILALVNAILECHLYQRINESLCFSFMHIVNHPGLRKWHHPVLDVGPAFAPYTELNYRLHPDVDESKINDELEMRFMASKMAIVSLLRTWTGLFHICHSHNMIKSFVDALVIPNEVVRRGILSVLSELFYFNELLWTKDFKLALKAAAPGHFRETWRISEGFVVAEGKSLLPVRCVSRPDLVDCHLALILSSFLQAGLLKALTDVAISSDSCSSVSAVIVLGSVLHLASRLLPADYESDSWQSHLPRLFQSESCHVTIERSLRLSETVKRLQEVYTMRSDSPKPYSVYLSQLLSKKSTSVKRSLTLSSSNRGRSVTLGEPETSPIHSFSFRRNRSMNFMRDFTDDFPLSALKNTKVLASRDHGDWDWNVLQSLFLSQHSTTFLKHVAVDDQLRRFYRRLIYFYHPTSRFFSVLDLAKDGNPDPNRIYVETAILMMKHLAYADEEGQRLLKNLVSDIIQFLPKAEGGAANYSKATGSLSVTCSREYFLILSALSRHPKGDNFLKQCKAYQYFLGLASKDTHESLIRLLVSSLHYSEDGPARMVLSRILTKCSESARLYATGFLRVLLRATYPGFQRWGIELLTTQLYDESNDVALEALDILHEACDDVMYLRSVVRLRPTLLHLGDRGAILVCRFMSVPQGFAYLSHNNYLNRELQRWWSEYNERYVTLVEELLKLSLTSYERPNKDDGFVRRSGNKKTRQSVYVPAHLYGELCRHKEGAALIEKENIAAHITKSLSKLVDDYEKERTSLKKEVFNNDEKNFSSLLKIKSYLWALGHIGSTIYGLPLLKRCQSLQLMTSLAFSFPAASIRGTCLYCLSTIAQTIPGVEALKKLGYQCVLKTVVKNDVSNDDDVRLTPPQPIVTPRLVRPESKSTSHSSQLSISVPSSSQKKTSAGSLSNVSITTDDAISTAGSDSKSIRSSKASSLKSKKNHKRSSSEARAPATSHTSNTDSYASVFESDPGDEQTPDRLSVARKRSLPVSAIPFPNRSKATSVSSVFNSQTKMKFKDRFMQIFQPRNRSKSANYGSHTTTESSSPIHAASSSYTSDRNNQLESIQEQRLKKDDPNPDFSIPIQLPTQVNIVQTSHIRTTTLASSKNSLVTITRQSSGNETSALSNDRRQVDSSSYGGGSGYSSDTARWNTNNSGQHGANLVDVKLTLAPSPSHRTVSSSSSKFTPVRHAKAFLNVSPCRKATSLPNITISSESSETSLSNFRLYSSASSSRLDSTRNELKGASIIDGSLVADDVMSIDVTPRNFALTDPSLKSRLGVEPSTHRDRGNTQTSHDSGVIIDTNPTSSVSRDNSPQTRMSDVASDLSLPPSSMERSGKDEQWRFTQPEGLPALCLIREEQQRRAMENRKSTLKRSILKSDILSYEERDYIISNTQYVGIVMPGPPSGFFMASVGQIPESSLDGPLQREAYNKEKQLEDAELIRERKTSSVRHAPKLRGLDESTFGPEVTAGLANTKCGRMHSAIMTPCGRTPDSVLSEASDLCYIGGQLVEPGSEEHVVLLHEEILQLVEDLASSVGVKSHETSLLMMKEKKAEVFDSISLYNNIVYIMSEHSFRLSSRRFVQELFQDVKFSEVHQEARKALKTVLD